MVGLLCLLLTGFQGFSQQQIAVYDSLSENAKAFYRYLPQGYPEAGVKYPMILFVHGFGENGPGTAATLPWVLRNGIPKLINEGSFPTSFTVNGTTFKFIIVSPQFTGFPSVNDINNTINYMVAKYPVDINRIYLTGLSMGGGAAWYYPGYDPYFANRIAATVPVCGSTETYQRYADNIANSNLPVWATHNIGDGTVSVNVTNTLISLVNNRPNPPRPLAKKTIFNVNGHDAWTTTYDPNFKEDGKNIYEWMLQYRRNFGVLVVDGLNFTATITDNATKVALKWTTIAETNMQGYKILKSSDGRNFSEIGFISTQSLNGSGAQYSFTDVNVNAGKSFYKLELVENNGATTFSEIRQINLSKETVSTVFPNPAKNQININITGTISKGELLIINTQGQKLMQLTLNSTGKMSIDISKLKPGNYIARIINGTDIENVKFIKQ